MSIIGFTDKYLFLSDYFNQSFKYDGIVYNNAICAYLAQLIENPTQKNIISHAIPRDAIQMIKRSKNVRQLTDEEKFDLMYQVCKAKFSNKELKDKLLATENEELINQTTWDNPFWGKTNKQGKNTLGKVLMKLREDLKPKKKSKKKETPKEQDKELEEAEHGSDEREPEKTE